MYARCMHPACMLPYWFCVMTCQQYILYLELHAGNTLYLYLVALNVRIKLFTDKEVTNWIQNKLKDKKYHEVLKSTMEEFIEQEKTKKKREEDADKTTPQRP